MIEFFRDGVWQFVGVVFTIIVPFLIYFWQRDRKELAFGVFYEAPLLSVSEELAKRVQISFDGSAISNLHLIVLAMKNSGNKPILTSDFERECVVAFGSEIGVLSADVTAQVPSNISARVERRAHSIHIMPMLLNPGDYFLVKVLVTGSEPSVCADMRIIGITRLATIKRHDQAFGRKKIRQNILLLPTVSLFSIAYAYWLAPSQLGPFIVGGCLLTFGAVLQWLLAYFSNDIRRHVEDA